MKKLYVLLFSLMTLLSFGANAQTQDLSTPKSALVNWVLENSHKGITMSKAVKFVDTAIKYAKNHSLDPLLVLSMIKVESGFKETARSGYGAKGLMQVVPRWHKDKLKGRNPFNPDVSVEVGTQVLKDCLDKHSSKLMRALACYSGSAKSYYQKVARNHTEMTRAMVEEQFLNEENIDVSYIARMEKNGYVSQFEEPLILLSDNADPIVVAGGE